MRTNLFSSVIITASLLSAQILFAQNTPYWSREGNANATSSSKLGTVNAVPLGLFTNNTTRVYISAAGNVGIGTTTPTQKLHVEGNGLISGNLTVGGPITGTAIRYMHSGAMKYYTAYYNGGLNITETGVADYRLFLKDGGNVGIGTATPAQRLHVEGNTYITGNSYIKGNVGIGTTTPTQKLHVEGNGLISGNLIAGGSINGGGPITGTAIRYMHSGAMKYYTSYYNGGLNITETGVADFRLFLKDGGNVGIGTATPTQRLHVEGNTFITGNSYVAGKIGLGTTSPNYKLEVQGGSTVAIAGFSNTTGIYGKGEAIGVYGTGASYGIYAGSPSGYGAYLYSSTGTGLYAATGRSDKNYAGVFQGNVYTTGLYSSSDKELKKNIKDLGDAMSLINQLKPRHYEFRQDGKYAALHLPQGQHYGLIAQELEEVLPGLVKEAPIPIMEPPAEPTAENGKTPTEVQGSTERAEKTIHVKAINYTELIPILVKALQEQDQKMEQQQQQINELKDLITRLSKGERISTSLSDAELLQNMPNPVKGSTSISYRIPEGVGRAQLVVIDVLGRTIKTLPLNKSGMVHFNVSGLSSGVYTYSLVIDNKVVQTKKMTVEK